MHRRSRYKGNIPTRKITLETGQILNCTDDHLIETFNGEFEEARELKVGDTVLMCRGTYQAEDGTDEDYSIGFIIGAFQGDGSFGGSDIIKFTIAKKEKLEFGKAIKEHLFNGFGVDVVTDSKHYTSDNAHVLQVRRWGLYRFLKSLNIKNGTIPLFVRQRSKKFIGGYIAGLFASDGCSVKGILQFASKDEQLIRELQIVLFYFGIISRIKSHKSGISSFLPGKIYWTLYVAAGNSHKNLKDLVENIPGKSIREDSRKRSTDIGVFQSVKIIDIEGAVKNNPNSRVGEPVYDVMDSDTHSFLANGVSVHNCLNYDYQRSISDKFFNMQLVYSQPKDIWLPYAYEPTIHYPDDTVSKDYDAVLIGMPYEQRNQWIAELRNKGVSVLYDNAPVFDDYRIANNRARIGLNWSSMQDLNARFFELPAMKLCPVVNYVPYIDDFFSHDDVLVFQNLNEATDMVIWCKEHPVDTKLMAENAYQKILPETYDARINQILKECGFYG